MPFLLLAYMAYYCLPAIGVSLSSWAAALITLVVYNTAYFAEILRGAWSHLPPQQEEGGRAFGFTGIKLFVYIIGPQLFIAAGPVLGNQLIQVIKDSAFLMVITIPELTFKANQVQYWEEPEKDEANLVILSVDPALSTNSRADRSALVVLAQFGEPGGPKEVRCLAASFTVVAGLPVTFTGPEVLTLMV